ncbi:MAG: phosphoribosylaminoimidazolesuccinocarboxamide synthase [Phycisphaerales bacterium]
MATVSQTVTPGTGGALFATDLALPGRRQGKVRDVYELPGGEAGGGGRLLIVASDRVSAFDVVLPTPIPGKGRVLTEISTSWFRFIESRGLARTHVLSTDHREVPAGAFRGRTTPEDLRGRSTIARRCRVIPIECVVRGYLEGSGWKDYQRTGAVSGVRLPPGLRQCDRLPEPIFTPATKAPQGQHDENISIEQAAEAVGAGLMAWLKERSLAVYAAAAEHALTRGIIIADTKFEWGMEERHEGTEARRHEGEEPILIDEALTPDSSRFWPAAGYRPGEAQKSFDKQYLREYLERLVAEGRWNKQAPGPALPAEIVERTREKYEEARTLLLGAG